MDRRPRKMVGSRRAMAPGFEWQGAASEMLAEFGLPRGRVKRFETFEEADEWLMKQTVARAREVRRRRISRGSPEV